MCVQIMFVFPFLLLSFLNAFVYGENELYKGYRVYNVKFDTEEQQNKLYVLKNDVIDFWRNPSHKHAITGRAMVPPSNFDWFEERLEELNVIKDIYIEDVFEYLNVKSRERQQENDRNERTVFDFDRYHRYDQILDHMRALEQAFTNSPRIRLEYIASGITDERRPLAHLKITSRSSITQTPRPVVIIEAGINPREWITIPSALNIVNRLVEERQARFLDNYEWIIVPVVNPDGYEYTHTNLRLWQKSRSTRSHLGVICPGVNINRNFDIDWLISGASSSPCSHLFAGIEPFSEPETRIIRNIYEQYGTRIRLYLSLQNNGGFISYPWQFEKAASGMFRHHHLLGLRMISGMGENYTLDVGSVALGDRASGTSTDYVRDKGVLFTFNVNIEQSDGVSVIIPESQIRPIAERIWATVAIAAENVMN